MKKKTKTVKTERSSILLLDIETAPVLAHVWGLWDQNIPLNMIEKDWHILSWSAKWLNDPPEKIMYMDQRKAKNIEDDKALLQPLWNLMDSALIIVGQNLDKFDIKKLNARFILNNMPPPSPFRTIDTLKLSKKKFAFTSNKLEYLSNNLAKKYKKLKHKEFPGFELWKAVLAQNQRAWKEMEAYNKMDVLSLEEVYKRLAPWDNITNLNTLDPDHQVCSCGSKTFQKRGYKFTNSGKFQIHRCTKCNKCYTSSKNLLTKEQKEKLLK